MRSKPWSFVALASLVGATLTVVSASPAHAAVLDHTCVTRQVTRYSPGVMFEPAEQKIRIKTKASSCTGTVRPDITSGFAKFTFRAERSCLDIDQTTSGTSAITWNTGETSVYTYDSTTVTIGGQIIVTIVGTVIAGPFEGSTITIVVVSPVDLLKCLFPPGITKRVGEGIVEISSL